MSRIVNGVGVLPQRRERHFRRSIRPVWITFQEYNVICSTVRYGMLFLVAAVCGAQPTVYVNNRSGDDTADGTGETNPVATIARAIALAHTSGRIALANTGMPYRESFALGKLGGTPEQPFVVEGNGAVISGLLPLESDRWEPVSAGVFRCKVGHRPYGRPYLVCDGRRLERASTVDTLAPEQFTWGAEEGIHFRCAEGREIGSYKLEATLRTSGLVLTGGSYVTCRNLVSERFANDGFSMHGDCRGIVLERVVARHNGDDGISIHEAGGVVVRYSHAHHNANGIQDVNASRSVYNGVLIEHNAAGAVFNGGFHSLVDCVIRYNEKDQVDVSPGGAKHLVGWETNPMCRSLVVLQNCLLAGDGNRAGLRVRTDSSAIVSHSAVTGSKVGVEVHKGGFCHLTLSVIRGCARSLSSETDQFIRDYNLYDSGEMKWLGRIYKPQDWDAFRSAAGHDVHSVVGLSAKEIGKPVGPTRPVPVFGGATTVPAAQ